jgi:hypothetical protein
MRSEWRSFPPGDGHVSSASNRTSPTLKRGACCRAERRNADVLSARHPSSVLTEGPKSPEVAVGHQNPDRGSELALRVDVGHPPLWPSPSSTSACVASSDLLCPAGEASRTKMSRSWSSGTRSVFSNVNSTHVCGIDLQIERSWRRSAACSRGNVGDPSWSPPRPFCAGIGKQPSTSGGGGENGEAPVGHRSQPALSISSFVSAGRTDGGDACASRASCESSGSACRPVQFEGSCAKMVSDRSPEADRPGRSSFAPRHTACLLRTSSPWTPCRSSSATCSS